VCIAVRAAGLDRDRRGPDRNRRRLDRKRRSLDGNRGKPADKYY